MKRVMFQRSKVLLLCFLLLLIIESCNNKDESLKSSIFNVPEADIFIVDFRKILDNYATTLNPNEVNQHHALRLINPLQQHLSSGNIDRLSFISALLKERDTRIPTLTTRTLKVEKEKDDEENEEEIQEDIWQWKYSIRYKNDIYQIQLILKVDEKEDQWEINLLSYIDSQSSTTLASGTVNLTQTESKWEIYNFPHEGERSKMMSWTASLNESKTVTKQELIILDKKSSLLNAKYEFSPTTLGNYNRKLVISIPANPTNNTSEEKATILFNEDTKEGIIQMTIDSELKSYCWDSQLNNTTCTLTEIK